MENARTTGILHVKNGDIYIENDGFGSVCTSYVQKYPTSTWIFNM